MSGGRLVSQVNGAFVAPSAAGIAPGDRGFTLGDGVFETLRAKNGQPLRWALHEQRLIASLAMLGIDPGMSMEELRGEVRACLLACGSDDSSVRISVSRGVAAERGLAPSSGMQPTVAIEVRPFAGYPPGLYKRGMSLVTSAIPRNERSPLARVKSLSYLENVLARMEAQEAGADEALVLNTAGGVAGASAANVFVVFEQARRQGTLVTPPVEEGALPGTVRGLVLGELAARCGLRAEEGRLLPGMLEGPGREVFLTNALMGVMPVTCIDGRAAGGGTPGSYAARVAEALEARDREETACPGQL